jgi:hypothetical protein
VSYFGTTATFRGYGIICMMVLAGFIFINFYRKDGGFVSDIPVSEDPHQVSEQNSLYMKNAEIKLPFLRSPKRQLT